MISADIQKLEPGNLVTLYELDLVDIGGEMGRYHNHNDGIIVWQGNSYVPWPIKAEGFARNGQGQQAQPQITISNIGKDSSGNLVTGIVSSMCIALDDLVGGRMTRRRTFSKYLDAVNFPDGNPTADPEEEFPPEIWIIEQKSNETPEAVTFTLSSPIDFNGRQLPARQIIASVCPWLWKGGYRGVYCQYTGTAMFDEKDNPVTDIALDKCGGRVTSCQKRFAAEQGVSEQWAVINFGGFVSSGRVGGQ